MENASVNSNNPEELFCRFSDAEEASDILQTFQRLLDVLGIHRTENPKAKDCYHLLKSKLQSWKCKSLWDLLDARVNLKEYGKGKTCEDLQVLVIGAGPIGLRTAIEAALLGAQVVVVEKRTAFSRNNVLHLWPFLLTDFRSLGAKKFCGKFCSGSIDHISIRKLQAILLKTALIFGAKVYTGVTFEGLVEPTNEEGWKCKVSPKSHAVNQFEVDVVIGADGKKNVLPGFAQIEMRGTLAIGITVNFVNHYTEDEKAAEEISGIAYQFNPTFFDTLNSQLGIKLENIVYYKDETHYFVMTASKSSLLKRGALKEDLGNPAQLLAPTNIHQSKLTDYAVDAVRYATKGHLRNLEIKLNNKNKPDIAAFDFTSIKKAEHAARIVERKGNKLLVGLVGDSLLEPFWPTGSGCARGVLSALDAAWMIRSFAMEKPPLQIISERENIYRLLSGTSDENLHKNHAGYTINPTTRYKNITSKKIREVYHLYDTDDPVNADFSLGSPTGNAMNKASRKRKVVVSKAFKRTRGNSQLHASDSVSGRLRSFSGSSGDVFTPPGEMLDLPLNKTSRGRTLSSTTSDKSKDQKKKPRRSVLSSTSSQVEELPSPRERSSTIESITGTRKGKRKGARKSMSSREGHEVNKAKAKKRGFFRPSFGLGRSKSKDISDKENEPAKAKTSTAKEPITKLSRKSGRSSREPFSRNQPTRRSAKDLIRDIEARAHATSDVIPQKEIVNDVKTESHRSLFSKKSLTTGDLGREVGKDNHVKLMGMKRMKTVDDPKATPPKLKKRESLLEQIARMSPLGRRALPVLTKLSPQANKENEGEDHSVMSAARNAAMVSMVMPLLIDDFKRGGCPARDKSMILRGSGRGRVRDVVNRYNTMGDETPKGWRKSDRTDGPDTISQNSDTLDNLGHEIREPPDGQDGNEHRSSVTIETEASVDGREKDPEAVVTGKSLVSRGIERLPSSPSLQLLRTKMRGLMVSTKPADESANDKEEHKVDLSSPIYQKTPIAAAMQERKEQDETKGNVGEEREKMKDKEEEQKWEEETPLRKSSIKEKGKIVSPAKPAEKGRGSSLTPPELMKEMLERLTSTGKPERAMSSLKYMINMFRAIELHPHNEKYRRVFKGRVKFRKYVGTVKSARLFIQTSGWVEIGSFLLFPLSKTVEEPLRILRKQLRIMNHEESDDELLDVRKSDRKLAEDRHAEAKRQHSDDTVLTFDEVKLTVGGKQSVPEKRSLKTEVETDSTTALIGEHLTKLLEQDCEDEQTVYDLIMENPLDDDTENQGLPNPESCSMEAWNDKALVATAVQCQEKPTLQDVDILTGTLDNLIDFLGDSEDTEKDLDKAEQETTQTQSENVPELDDLSQTLNALMHVLSSDEEEVFERTEPLDLECTALDANTATENSKKDISRNEKSMDKSGCSGVEKDLSEENGGASLQKSNDASKDLFCQPNVHEVENNEDKMQLNTSHIIVDEKSRTAGRSEGSQRVSNEENVSTEVEPRQENIKSRKASRERLQSADDLLQAKRGAVKAQLASNMNGKVRSTRRSVSTEDKNVVVEKSPVVPCTSRRRSELSKAKSLNELNRADLSMRILEAGKRARMRNAVVKAQSMDSVTINQNQPAVLGSLPRTVPSTPGTSQVSGVENAIFDKTSTSAFPRKNAGTPFSKAKSLDDLTNRRVEMSLESKRELPVRAESVNLIEKTGNASSKRAKRREEIAAKLELLDAVLASRPSQSGEISEACKSLNGKGNADSRSEDTTLVDCTQPGELPPKKSDSEIFKVPEIPVKRTRNSTTKKAGRRQRGPSSDKSLSSGSEEETSHLSTNREERIIQPRRTRASALRERAGSVSSRSDSENEKQRSRPSSTIRRPRSSVSGERSGVSSASLTSCSASKGEDKRLKTSESNSRGRRARPVSEDRNGAFSSSEDEQKAPRARTRNTRSSSSREASRTSSASEDEKVKKNLRAGRTRPNVSRRETRASSASEDEKNADQSFRAGRTRSSVSREINRVSSASEEEKKPDKSLRKGRTRPSSIRNEIGASSATENEPKLAKEATSGGNSDSSTGQTRASSRFSRLSSSEEKGSRCNERSDNHKTQTRRTRASISTESDGEKKPTRKGASRTSSSSLKTRISVAKERTHNSSITSRNQSGNENEMMSSKVSLKDIPSRTRRTRVAASSSNKSASEDEHRSTANSTDNAARTRRTRSRVSGKPSTWSSVSLSSHSASEDEKKQSRRTRRNVSEVKPLASSTSRQSDNETEDKKAERSRTCSGISGERPVSSTDPNEDETTRMRGLSKRTDEVSRQQGDAERAGIPTQLLCHADSDGGGELVEKKANGNANPADFVSESVRGEVSISGPVTMEMAREEFPQVLPRITSAETLEKGDIPEDGDLAEPVSPEQGSIIDGISLSKDEHDHEVAEDFPERAPPDSFDAPSISSAVPIDTNEVEIAQECSGEELTTELHPNGFHLETSERNWPAIPAQVNLQNGHPTPAASVERRNGGQRQSRKDVVSLTFEERKQQLFEAANAPPKTAKPVNSRRSILQIQNRNGGQLVNNAKGVYEAADKEPATAKSSKSRYLGFLHRKNKGPGKTSEARRQLPDVQEAIDKKLISDCQHPLLSAAVSVPDIYLASAKSDKEVDSSGSPTFLSLPRNSSGLRRQLPKTPEGRHDFSSHANSSVSQASPNMVMYKSSPNLLEVGDDEKEECMNTKNDVKREGRKSRSPFRLSPLRLKMKKKSGSYDLPQMQ